jgi:hypothetical protein
VAGGPGFEPGLTESESSGTDIGDALTPLDLEARAFDAALRNAFRLSKRWLGMPPVEMKSLVLVEGLTVATPQSGVISGRCMAEGPGFEPGLTESDGVFARLSGRLLGAVRVRPFVLATGLTCRTVRLSQRASAKVAVPRRGEALAF